jgi:phage terminase large subunit-like protein
MARQLDALDGSRFPRQQPVTRWTAANVTVVQDPAGNLEPAKDKSGERIDGIVTLIMAIGRAMLAQEEPQPEYSLHFV